MTPATAKKPVKPQPKKTSSYTVPSYKIDGTEDAPVAVPEAIFGVDDNKQLLSQYVYMYVTNKRQGNVSAKTRAEVIGTTKKMYRQKGTGRARHGTKKASLFVGGGVTFGPKPREFSLSMNKKQKKKALFMSLSLVYKDGGVAVITGDTAAMEPKTARVAAMLKKSKLDDKKTLFVFEKVAGNNMVRAARNIADVTIRDVQSLNAYDVLNARQVLFVAPSIDRLTAHFLKK